MKSTIFLAVLAAVPVFTAPLEERAVGPTVTIASGTVVGSSGLGVESFKGIPFAQPPVGNLRLRAPQPFTTTFGTLMATGTPRACHQYSNLLDSSLLVGPALSAVQNSYIAQTATNSGEDCLTLNVQRPSGTNSSSSLPVLVWIYGGGFETGSTQTYDASNFIQRSISLGKPIVYVAMNYRLGGFGFLGGKALAGEGNTNLGLRDQRLALQWVQDNVAAFGGDPTKVTIWGESAGSISVFDHTVINNGDNTYKGKPLFRAAIMDSGSIVPADTVSGPSAQAVYDTVVKNAGCSSSSDTLACLRALDYTTFSNAADSPPGIFSYRSLDLSYLPRPDPGNSFFSASPETSVVAGKFAKVPIIIGDQEDEGTLFSLVLSNVTTTQKIIDYLTTYFPTNPNARSDVTGLVANYPDNPSAGSPFNTGPLNELYPEYKRIAAILGDITFTLTRRVYLNIVASQVKSWSYLASYFYGTPLLGTFHGSDILVAYGTSGPSVPTFSIESYYISFINTLNPNSLGTSAPLINWPQWTTSTPTLLNFQALQNALIPDTFRQASAQYLASKTGAFRV